MRNYDAGTGRLERIESGATSDDYVDTFDYDALARLTSQATTVGASRTLGFGFDARGNLTSKTSSVSGDLDVTGYSYSGAHRLSSVSIGGISNTLVYYANGNLTRYNAASGDGIFADSALSGDGHGAPGAQDRHRLRGMDGRQPRGAGTPGGTTVNA